MYAFIRMMEFTRYLFDDEEVADKAAHIVEEILEARSPRLSDIFQRMRGTPAANYKAVQRFLAKAEPRAALLRLFEEEAPFVIGDPTEVPRPQPWKTPYVGALKDGKTKRFWLLMLATPFRGRAIPFSFVTYSSRTIAEQTNSRNPPVFTNPAQAPRRSPCAKASTGNSTLDSVLLKQKLLLSTETLTHAIQTVLQAFAILVNGDVRTYV